MGGSADRRYNLSFIVENSVKQGTPVIGVSLNYRLSVFGFPGGKEAVDANATNLGLYVILNTAFSRQILIEPQP